MVEYANRVPAPRIWQVGALCRAVADHLDARFNPIAVRGELSGFLRAASGHCYFSIKDEQGQLRCAMFRRAALLLDFEPTDGETVELRGRLGVYEARGDLQLVVESMRRAGAGALFEQFLRLKGRLEAEGLFEPARKRPLPPLPRTIGVVTSLDAAALHDVLAALRRRAPHVAVIVAPARVQGSGAAADLCAALSKLHRTKLAALAPQADLRQEADMGVDLVLLVRGGGSIEDLWAFNDEQLARAICASPVPVVVGVGHETDFTIADFCADLRAPTPTAAAELAAAPRQTWLEGLARLEERLRASIGRELEGAAQRLDRAAARLGRPSALAHSQRMLLARRQQRLTSAVLTTAGRQQRRLQSAQERMQAALQSALRRARERLGRAEIGLSLLDPRLVLGRGYALLTDEEGAVITRTAQARAGQALRATLSDGTVDLTVTQTRVN